MSNQADLTVEQIVNALRPFTPGEPLPVEALRAARARQQEITPILLEELGKAAADLPHYPEDSNLCFYALFLLAEFRETRALPMIVQYFSWDEETVEIAVGDLVTCGLDRLLASVCGDDIRPIQSLIENKRASEWARAAAIEALAARYAHGLLERATLAAYFRTLLGEGGLEEEDGFALESLAITCEEAYLDELTEPLLQLFKRCEIDPSLITPEMIQETFRKPADEVLEEFRKRHGLITDVVAELEDWACFHPEEHDDEDEAESEEAMEPPIPVVAAPKVGRNELCPCGSGKKYKKCCGAPK